MLSSQGGAATPTRREMLVASGIIAALLTIPLIVPALRVMYLKPLWLDELHTWLLSRHLPGPQLIEQLRRGADFNPPLLHVVDSLALRVFGNAPPQLVLRLTSLASIWIALVLLYRICRERLSVSASAIGVMALLTHATLVSQSRDARFYAPWLALAAAAAWSMQRTIERPTSALRLAQLALVSVALCLVHYFGVISLACLAAGVLIGVRPLSRLVPTLAALAAGPLALASWLPVYAAQRQVLSVSTWIAAPTRGAALDFVVGFLAWQPVAPVMIAAAAWTLFRAREGWPELPRPSAAQYGLLGLVAMPFVIVAFSFLVQPALMPRYALPALLGVAVVISVGANLLPARVQPLVLLLLLAGHGALLRRQLGGDRRFDREVRASVSALGAMTGDGRPVVSMERHAFYPAALSSANRNGHVAFLVLPTPAIDEHVRGIPGATSNFTIVERDAAAAHHRIFGFPRLITLDEMRRLPSFYLLLEDDSGVPS